MIRSLELRDFKSFAETSLPFGPLTLLVGTNASGKSNVRDALRLLHGCGLGYSLADILGGKWGPDGNRVWGGLRGGARELARFGQSETKLGIELGSSNLRLDIAFTVPGNGFGEPHIARESLHDSTAEIYHGVFWDKLRRLRTKSVGATGDLIGDYSPRLPLFTQLATEDRMGSGVRSQARTLADNLAAMRFLDLAPHAMREASLPGQQILGDRGENLSSVLLDICQDTERKHSLLAWLRSLTPMDVIDLEFKEDFQGRVLVHLVENGGHLTSAVSASDGTLRFLALVAALLSSDSGKLYFFEEIDNGFHPTRLHLLLDVLEQASRGMGCQVVATTHNPQLLAFLSERARRNALVIFRREGSNVSEARRLLDLPGIEEILEKQDLGLLFATGWLEDAVEFVAGDLHRASTVATES